MLALIAALLAFIPTIGAMISGVILVTVAFTVGNVEGFWALGLFLLVQQVEGNILTPQIEKRAVDIAPAVVLGAQLLFGVLFAINSSLHSYLIVSYAKADGVSLDVGFYYMANAAGRLVGTLLSGWAFQAYGLVACLWISGLLLLGAVICTWALRRCQTSAQVTG
ncbi:MAG: hypothetical protein B7Z18_07180 [Alishewanella sp. 32-51-5]|nr:MAG: hypothetical protein B7Z18_07180 [Alishewanella sp. 32-51-5]